MTDSQKWLVIAGVAVCATLLYLLAPVLTPFLIAATLAYMGDPLVDRIEVYLSRTWAVLIVFILITLAVLIALFVLLPMLEQQISHLVTKMPVYIDRVQNVFLPWLRETLGGVDMALDLEQLKEAAREHWQKAGGVAVNILGTVSRSGLVFVAWLANLLLIPVLTFYLLRDWDILVARVHELIPRRAEPTIAKLARDSDEVLGAFLRGQVSVMIALGSIYSVGLWLVGLDLALLIGMLAGLVSFVPYLGFLVGIIAAGVAGMLQFQDVFMLLPIAGVFLVGQLVESFLLTPWLVGDRIGLHPVAVIFAVMAGGQLFGFFGILLALPIAAVIMVVLRHAHERYVKSQLYAGSNRSE